MHPSVRRLSAFATLTLLLCISCESPHKPEPRLTSFQRFFGDGWLAWSPAERTEFVVTYLDAYTAAYNDACRRAEDIFIESYPSGKSVPVAKLPYEKGDENSIDIPLTHCLNSQPKYSLGKRDEDGVMKSPYAEIITEMYQKHPDARSAPYFLLITLLSDGKAQTSEDLYKDQLGKWPNARYDPSFSPAH
jgi:hypothetical protein